MAVGWGLLTTAPTTSTQYTIQIILCLDMAVGAPYDGPNQRGAVYIFLGSADGVIKKPSQVIHIIIKHKILKILFYIEVYLDDPRPPTIIGSIGSVFRGYRFFCASYSGRFFLTYIVSVYRKVSGDPRPPLQTSNIRTRGVCYCFGLNDCMILWKASGLFWLVDGYGQNWGFKQKQKSLER